MRRLVPWILTGGLLIAVAVTAVLASVGLPGAAPGPSPAVVRLGGPATGFGGYASYGDVSTISASWQVPAILPTSFPGSMAAWIGAEGVAASMPPFVQVGTLEFRNVTNQVTDQYGAFWSSTGVGFSPRWIRAVSPGDQVAAAMTRTPAGWTLRFSDLTAGWSQEVATGYGARQRYVEGIWSEEDPASPSVGYSDENFPETSTLSFSGLEIDGHPPSLQHDEVRVLYPTGGGALVPDPQGATSFSLVAPSDRAAGVFSALRSYAEEADGCTLASVQNRLATVANLADYGSCESVARQRLMGDLEVRGVAPGVRAAAVSSVAAEERLTAAYLAWEHAGARPGSPLERAYLADRRAVVVTGQRLLAVTGPAAA